MHCSSPIEGLTVVTLSEPYRDERGSFTRLFCSHALNELIAPRSIVQISHSVTKHPQTVRGLHFQRAPHQELKMVRCIRGKVWDVAVDNREGSPTRYKWHGEELSCENNKMMLIPEGFAHGFQVLEANTELLYFITTPYNAQADDGLHPLDPVLAIAWPLEVQHLSKRDANHSMVLHANV